MPGIVIGRGSFVDSLDVLVFSPKIRSLRSTPVFVNRVPLLYTFDVADPPPRFYLADHVEIVDEQGLERLVAKREPFLCLTFKQQASGFLNKHRQADLQMIASTDYLAVIQYR